MQIATVVESPGFTNDFSLKFVVIYPGGRLHEERRRWPARANDNAVFDEVTTGRPDVVFDSFGVATQTVFALYPVVITTARDI